MALQRPRLWWQYCFNADPNDPSAVPIWTDYTSMVRRVGTNRRGRLYELAQSVGAEPPIEWRDPSEILNPVNTSSPEYPYVLPYRQILGQAMWPNDDVSLGSAVNLLNANRWHPNNEVAADPSFESYANGAAMPNWLTAYGPVTPTITTTNPQQGTKSLTYAADGAFGTTRQGVRWTVATVPGNQYTSSVYVRQSAAMAQNLRLSVTDQTLLYDFLDRTSASTWTTSTSGLAYANSGGANGDYTVAPGVGSIEVSATNSERITTVDIGAADATIQALLVDVGTPEGAGTRQGLMVAYTDANNYFMGSASVDTSGYVTASIYFRVAGVLTLSGTRSGVARAGQSLNMILKHEAGDVSMKLWPEGEVEPEDWTITGGATGMTGTRAGCFAFRETSNTSPTTFRFSNIYAVGNVNSSTNNTLNAYVRLSVTWTATQPFHVMQMANATTAFTATINMDAMQHEPGASASTFTTDGPVIFPILRNYAERFPREYEAAGFVGKTVTPAVDGFAALNSISISSDYETEVQLSGPVYYWTLSGGADTLQALESSGSGGPSLSQYDTVGGPGNPPVFSSQITILGDPGATGVRFQPAGAIGDPSSSPDSALAAGRVPGSPGIAFPAAYRSFWAVSIAAWVNIPDTAEILGARVAQPSTSLITGTTIPIGMLVHHPSPGTVEAEVICQSPSGIDISVTGEFEPDTPCLIVGTVTQQDGGGTYIKIYINGELADDALINTIDLGGLFTSIATVMDVGGYRGSAVVDGVVSRVALWERALSADDVAALWTAGGLGNAGELTGARLDRHLTSGGYAGARRISAGSTTLQPATFTGQIDLLSDAQQITLVESGTLWVAPDGALVMEGRQDRWLRLTSLVTFGEDVASGEIPYLDGVIFDYDPTFVYANVQITRNSGAAAQGGTRAEIVATARKFFARSYAIGGDFETDTQAQEYADYTFNTHKAPLLRVSAITIDPSAYPTIWNKALNLEIGQRVTVKRRASAGNGGAGLVMSADYFIESVTHHEIIMDNQSWRISLLLSPIGVVPGPSFQPWILENATYGVLDSTTILGW